MSRDRDPLVVKQLIRDDAVEPFTTRTISFRVSYGTQKLGLFPIVNPPRVDIGGDDIRVFCTLVMVDDYDEAPNPSDTICTDVSVGLRKNHW
ncbi:hypothetical protein RCOM_1125430 [Ricinus communis]|uniref:Uncharacterized protein n=1 Tax=Ricinus communis TaxID=3988 RepID=B9SRE4_RICCO|nr:hypothetical protein RCOM_1125430 [Ricinus communis]